MVVADPSPIEGEVLIKVHGDDVWHRWRVSPGRDWFGLRLVRRSCLFSFPNAVSSSAYNVLDFVHKSALQICTQRYACITICLNTVSRMNVFPTKTRKRELSEKLSAVIHSPTTSSPKGPAD